MPYRDLQLWTIISVVTSESLQYPNLKSPKYLIQSSLAKNNQGKTEYLDSVPNLD